MCWSMPLSSIRSSSVVGNEFRPMRLNEPQGEKNEAKLKFWVEVKEELYYLSSENKCADQLCSYCTADLCLCFCIGKNPFLTWLK